jgi:hypothetical protein
MRTNMDVRDEISTIIPEPGYAILITTYRSTAPSMLSMLILFPLLPDSIKVSYNVSEPYPSSMPQPVRLMISFIHSSHKNIPIVKDVRSAKAEKEMQGMMKERKEKKCTTKAAVYLLISC